MTAYVPSSITFMIGYTATEHVMANRPPFCDDYRRTNGRFARMLTRREISIPVKAGDGSYAKQIADNKGDHPAPPKRLVDFDALMRRCHRYYGQRLNDEVLLRAIDAVAEHTGKLVHEIRRLRIGEFVKLLDEAMGKPQHGPDPNRPILYWSGEIHELTHGVWKFLLVVWGRHNVPYVELAEAIWNDDMTASGTIRKRVTDVNKYLKKLGIPLTFTSSEETVSLMGNGQRSYRQCNAT